MNPKVEKILKLPLYQRLSILGIALLLVVACFVWLFWLPESDKLAELDQELKRVETELAQKQQIASNLPKFKEEFAKMERQLEKALKELPNEKEIPTLLTNLATLAKDSGLDVKKFQPLGEVPKGFFAEVPSNLVLEGSYHQIAEFAQAVGGLSRIVNLSNLNLKSPRTSGDKAILTITCKVTTFRFIEQ